MWPEVVRSAAIDPPSGRTIADIGGADGTQLAALLDADPTRRGIVFDLPHMVPAARELLAQRGLDQRAEVAGGDFFVQVPAADVYLLSMILHDWDDAAATRILHAINTAAASGARLLVAETIVPPGTNRITASQYARARWAAGWCGGRVCRRPPFS